MKPEFATMKAALAYELAADAFAVALFATSNPEFA
jgi:hypothetical protein